jgi:transcriptional regulator with XRE-family HTH domain
MDETLGDRLRQLREARGLSLRAAAGAVGSSFVHLWQVETGRSPNPGVRLAFALARLYGVTVEYLMEGKA